jgi:peptide/nickel transport system substrate-binding protein
MMKQKRTWMIWFVLFAISLVAAQCGGAAPAPEGKKEAEVAKPTEAKAEEKPAAVATADLTPTPGVVDKENKLAEKPKYGGVFTTDKPDVSAPRTQKGGTYRAVQTSDAVSFHPYLTTDASSSGYQGLVYAGSLLSPDENTLEYKPYMAEKYEISDDGLTFTFYLRKDMQWSDGQPLTARDYEWTYTQVMDPKHEYPYRSQVDFIKSYKALDDYTIQVKIEKIHAPALVNISGFITPLPKHIWEKLSWDDPEKNPEINHPSVVSGPYKLVEWKRDQFIKFTANDKYWYHGAPNMTEYSIETIPDQDVAFQKMKNNEVDSSGMTPEQLKEARTLDNVNVYEWWPAAAVWTYIGLNMRDGFVTNDLNIRHGLNYAIDKELLTDQIWLGQAKRLCSIYPPTTWAYSPDVPCYEFSKEKALEAFGKAGYTLKDDKLVNAKGEQLKLRLIYGPNTNPTRQLLAESTQDFLKKVGIEVEVKGMEWASYLEALQAKEPQWDLFIAAWQSGIEPHSQATVWAEENIPQLNSVAYINPEMTKHFEEAAATYDIDARKKAYAQVQKIISEDSPYIFISYRKSNDAENKRIKGIEPKTLGIGWNSEDWYIQE